MNPVAPYSAEPARGWLPWGALVPFLSVLFVVAPLLGVSRVLEHLQLLDAKGAPLVLPGLFPYLALGFGMSGAIVLAWVRYVERRPLATLGLGGTRRAEAFVQGLAVGLATSLGVVVAIWLIGGYVANGYGKALQSPRALLEMGILPALLCTAGERGGVDLSRLDAVRGRAKVQRRDRYRADVDRLHVAPFQSTTQLARHG